MKKVLVSYGKNKQDWNKLKQLIENEKELSSTYNFVITHDKKELRNNIEDTNIFFGFKLDKKLFKKAKQLEWMQFSSAGVNHTINEENLASDVIITSSKGIHGKIIAEQVVAMVLYFSKGLNVLRKRQNQKIWKRDDVVNKQYQLEDKNILVLGYGNIGKEICEYFKKFNSICYGIKKHVKKSEINNVKIYKMDQLYDILSKMDIVIDVLPLTDETKNVIDKTFWKEMKEESIFINVGRGKHMVEEDLVKNSSHLRGLGLDVTPEEPLPEDSKIWELDNVLITQHTSGDFKNYLETSFKLFLKNLKRYSKGEELFNIVDKNEKY